jgi:hypothetical protein
MMACLNGTTLLPLTLLLTPELLGSGNKLTGIKQIYL